MKKEKAMIKIKKTSGEEIHISEENFKKAGWTTFKSVKGFIAVVAHGGVIGRIVTVLVLLFCLNLTASAGNENSRKWKKSIAPACKADSGFIRFYYGAQRLTKKNCFPFKKRKRNKRGLIK